jgi:hypothetical protein
MPIAGKCMETPHHPAQKFFSLLEILTTSQMSFGFLRELL